MLSPQGAGLKGDACMYFLLAMRKGLGEFEVLFIGKHSFASLVSSNSLWSLLQNLSFESWSVI